MRSPFIAIAAYENRIGVPANYINCSMCVSVECGSSSWRTQLDYFLKCSVSGEDPMEHGKNLSEENLISCHSIEILGENSPT